jgi:hypothetical protein
MIMVYLSITNKNQAITKSCNNLVTELIFDYRKTNDSEENMQNIPVK